MADHSKTDCMDPAERDFWRDLSAGREVVFRGRGDSMAPLFPDGSLFVLKRTTLTALRIGDIVWMQDGARIGLHRYLGRMRDERLRTKGDRLAHSDAPWPANALKGRVVAVLKGGKEIDLRSQTNRALARLIAAASPAAGVGLRMLRFLKRRIKR